MISLVFITSILQDGVWHEFLKWSIYGSFSYISHASSLIHFWHNLAVRGGAILASCFLMWFFSARGMWQISSAAIVRDKNVKTAGGLFIITWFVASIIPVCTGGKFYDHYFLQVFPQAAILASIGIILFLESIERRTPKIKRFLMILLWLGFLIPSVGFFAARIVADDIYAAIGEENPKTYIPVANYIRDHTTPNDRIFVWGFATPIYTYANRLAASRFLWCDWLTGRVSGTSSAKDPAFDTSKYIVKDSWKLLFADMMHYNPKYFVDSSPGNYHDYGKYPLSKYPKLKRFIDERYHLEKSINGIAIYRRNG